MAKIERFEDIVAWQRARHLTTEVYKISNQGQFAKDFGLRDQIRRSAISIPSNIAEGFERNGRKEFIQFLSIAKASAGELRTQLYLASDLGYITEHEFKEVFALTEETSKLISGLMTYLQKSEFKGAKYYSI